MGSKNRPGKFDCYDRADPDEPMFVLLGSDPAAPFVVTFWVKMRMLVRDVDETDGQVDEARQCASDMETWARKLGKAEQLNAAFKAFEKVIDDGATPRAEPTEDGVRGVVIDVSNQPCRMEADGASPDFPCSQTSACATEWCRSRARMVLGAARRASTRSPDEARDLQAMAALRDLKVGMVALTYHGGEAQAWQWECDDPHRRHDDPADAILAALGKDESDAD